MSASTQFCVKLRFCSILLFRRQTTAVFVKAAGITDSYLTCNRITTGKAFIKLAMTLLHWLTYLLTCRTYRQDGERSEMEDNAKAKTKPKKTLEKA